MSVPALRFPEFTGEWELQPLNKAWRVKGRRNADNAFGKDRVLSVSGEKGIVNQIEHLGRSYAGVVVDNYHVVETGDIVYTKSPLKSNPFGIIKANKGISGIVSTLYAVYEVRAENSPEFWDRYFELNNRTNHYLKPLVHIGAKNDMKINNERVLIDPVSFPSLPEQKKIAAFLGVVDEKIAALRARQAGLEKYKRGLMQALFSQTLRFTKPDGTAFPDWEEKRLGDLLTVRYGKDHKGVPDGEIPVLGTGGVMRHVDRSLHDGPSVLIGRKGTIDKPRFVTQPFWTVDTLFYSDIKQEYLPFFVFLIVLSINWLRYNEATGVPSLSATAIHSVKVTVPPHPDEQQKIADALSAIDVKTAAVTDQIDKMKNFKKGLLQQMFI